MIKYMQGLGVLSFLLCALSMLSLFMGYDAPGKLLFGASIVMLAVSLVLSLVEVLLSTNALEIVVEDLERPGATTAAASLQDDEGRRTAACDRSSRGPPVSCVPISRASRPGRVRVRKRIVDRLVEHFPANVAGGATGHGGDRVSRGRPAITKPPTAPIAPSALRPPDTIVDSCSVRMCMIFSLLCLCVGAWPTAWRGR